MTASRCVMGVLLVVLAACTGPMNDTDDPDGSQGSRDAALGIYDSGPLFRDAAQPLDAAGSPDAGAVADAAVADAARPDAARPDAAIPDASPPVADAGGGMADGGTGTWEDPIVLDPLPATVSGNTTTVSLARETTYTPCAPTTDERGPEVVYVTTPVQDGTLRVAVDDVSGDNIDVDIHLLTAPNAQSCVARANVSFTHHVTGGVPVWVVVDTWFNGSMTLPGPYSLSVSLMPDPMPGTCPSDMLPVAGACMDRYEAPNVANALPLVMYTFTEAEAWCQARGRRLCFEDEWTGACEGAAQSSYPYGNTRQPGVCNDDKVWRTYNQPLLNGWPASASASDIADLDALYARASAVSATAASATTHVQSLYQADGSGQHTGCTNEIGIMDLVGNVEEWTRRRNGVTDFHGNLKGRYWADTRTCQNNITTHGDGFRFYEIGFRCCMDVP